MYTYCADDIMSKTTDTLDVLIEKKISLLYELCMLTMRKHKNDPREDAVRKILSRCTSGTQIDNALYGVVRYECTINDLIRAKGVI
jgi:hypothetical protein